jgi:hypothetical protein
MDKTDPWIPGSIEPIKDLLIEYVNGSYRIFVIEGIG